MFVTAVLALCSFACGGDDGASTACDFEITVVVGTSPTYNFTGGDVASVNLIRDEDPGTVVWGVFANPPGDNIASPVDHGTVPANASLRVANEITLTSGVFYTVIIAREDGVTCEESFIP
jgi:hypothetical protein